MGSNPIPAILSLRSTILVVRRTVYPEVAGSYPVGVVFMGPKLNWGSACVDAGGWEFKSLRFHYAGMAQLEEQLICNQQVSGSSPDVGFSGVISKYPGSYYRKKEKKMRKTKRKQKVRKQYSLRQ